MRKVLLSPWFSLVTLALVIVLRVADPSFIESIRLRYFDTIITSQQVKPSEQIRVVNIDDETIKRYGQFPFPRDKYAEIIQTLFDHQAGLVVFNVFMPESDRFGKDNELKKIIDTYPVILPEVGVNDSTASVAPKIGVSEIGESARPWAPQYTGIQSNIPEYQGAAGIGVVNTLPEIDGVTRRIPMVVSATDTLYPSISMETLRVAAGDPSFQIKSNESGIEAVRIPQFGKIDTDEFGRIWIDWSNIPMEYSFNRLPDSFDGGIVIVGLTGRGLNNPVATARGNVYPHQLQSTVLDTILKGTNISRPDWATVVELLSTLLLSIVSILLVRWKYGFIPVIAAITSIHFGVSYIFNNYHYLLDATIPVLGIFLVYAHSFTCKFVTELNAKLQIKRQFGGYLSPIMVERLQKNPELIKLGGERKELSVVMSDMRNFTTLGESYGDHVEEFTSTMNSYMTHISEPILEHDGCLIKFIGDASLHVHGAPLDDVNHAVSAVKAGLGMIAAVDKFNLELESQGKPPVGMGVGVNTGETLIGNIGSKTRFGYDVLGDTVSLTARLEGQTKGYGVLLIVGPKTAELVKDDFPLTELDCIAVKGKSIGVKMYTVANPPPEHQLYLEAYYAGDWKSAAIICKHLSEQPGDLQHYYELMLERISGECPDNWTGTYHATSK
jgi:adenylate cyclase